MVREMPHTERAGRQDAGGTLGRHLFLNHRQAAIHLLSLCLDNRRGGEHSRRSDKGPTCLINPSRICSRVIICMFRCAIIISIFLASHETNRPVLAIVDTVHTHHASAIVDKMVLAVDAGCLAGARAQPAAVANKESTKEDTAMKKTLKVEGMMCAVQDEMSHKQ